MAACRDMDIAKGRPALGLRRMRRWSAAHGWRSDDFGPELWRRLRSRSASIAERLPVIVNGGGRPPRD